MSAAVFSQPGVNELSIAAVRHGEEIVVSGWVHNPADGPVFEIVDLLGSDAAGPGHLAGLRDEPSRVPAGPGHLAGLRDEPSRVAAGPGPLAGLNHELSRLPAEAQTAIWGVSLPGAPGRRPVNFTMTLMLGRAPGPDGPLQTDPVDVYADAWDGAEVAGFALDGHPGQRRSRLVDSPAINGRSVQLLTVGYVAGTPYGVLTVAFGTPHVDVGDLFTVLFDRIAASLRIVTAGPADTI